MFIIKLQFPSNKSVSNVQYVYVNYKVNCEKERLTCKKQEITGYPKIIAFYQGSKVRCSLPF